MSEDTGAQVSRDKMNQIVRSINDLSIQIRWLTGLTGFVGVGLLSITGFGLTQLVSVQRELGSITTSISFINGTVKSQGDKIDLLSKDMSQVVVYQRAALDQKEAVNQLAMLKEWKVLATARGRELLNGNSQILEGQKAVVVFKNKEVSKGLFSFLKSRGSAPIAVRSANGSEGVFISEAASWRELQEGMSSFGADADSLQLYFDSAMNARAIRLILENQATASTLASTPTNFAILPQ